MSDLKSVLAEARRLALPDGALDDAVHEIYSSMASNKNNEGLESQVEFLVDQLGVEGAMKEISSLS